MAVVVVKRSKLPRFSEELNEPIVERLPLLHGKMAEAVWGPDLEKERERELRSREMKVAKRRKDKLYLLLKHYRIEPQNPRKWFCLSWRLACDFVPGMRAMAVDPAKRGRPPTWKGVSGLELVQAVDAIKTERRNGIRDAIRVLRARNPQSWGRHKPSGLETRYYETRRARKQRDTD
jgi:hypothetical protein